VQGREDTAWIRLAIPQYVPVDALPDGAHGLQAGQALPRIALGDVGLVCPILDVRRHQTRLPRVQSAIQVAATHCCNVASEGMLLCEGDEMSAVIHYHSIVGFYPGGISCRSTPNSCTAFHINFPIIVLKGS